jgi:ankyrin repeat protein/truncated hemoglobin YjbI
VLDVRRFVDLLYDRLERDPALARQFGNRRRNERQGLADLVATLLGDEVIGTRDVGMQRRHVHRLVTAEESRRWLEHVEAALDEAGADGATRDDLLDRLRGPAARLVNEGAPKAELRDALAAAAKGDVDVVAGLVDRFPGLLDQRGPDGRTLLWTAAWRGRLPLVRWLVERGADITIPGSAVHVTQVVVSPYVIAVRSRRREVVAFLLDHGVEVDIFAAAYLGDLDALAGFVAAGEAHRQDPHEDLHPVTPLHHAVDGGSVDAVRLLLDHGADARTAGGRLLSSAADQGSVELVRLLLDHGADARDAERLGPVATDPTVARLLVEAGFDLDRPVRDQETPLTMACRADKGARPELVAGLLALGADPNAPNARGRTPLDLATAGGSDEVVALLRAAGAT